MTFDSVEEAAEATTVTVGRTEYLVTINDVDSNIPYTLTGPRGAVYFALRNHKHPDRLFLVNGRKFGSSAPDVWFREVGPGQLEALR